MMFIIKQMRWTLMFILMFCACGKSISKPSDFRCVISAHGNRQEWYGYRYVYEFDSLKVEFNGVRIYGGVDSYEVPRSVQPMFSILKNHVVKGDAFSPIDSGEYARIECGGDTVRFLTGSESLLELDSISQYKVFYGLSAFSLSISDFTKKHRRILDSIQLLHPDSHKKTDFDNIYF